MSTQNFRLARLRTRWSAVGAAVAITLGAGGLSMAQAAIDTGDRPVTVSITAERILDTRTNLGLAGRFADATPRDIQVTGSVPVASGPNKTVVPADAIGVLVNVTVVTPTHEGFLSLRPQGAAGEPTTSTVNFFPGAIEPNGATVDLNGGKIQIWVETSSDSGSADVLIDVVGYTIGHTHDDRYYTETEADAVHATKANSADVYTKTEADTRYVPQGDIVVTHGPGAFGNPAASVETVFGTLFRNTSGSGFANMPITGPSTLGAVDYGLKSITYCTNVTAPGFITSITVWGMTGPVTQNPATDNTDRTIDGCYTVTVNDNTSTSFTIAFNYSGGGGTVDVTAVTSTWAPDSSIPSPLVSSGDLDSANVG